MGQRKAVTKELATTDKRGSGAEPLSCWRSSASLEAEATFRQGRMMTLPGGPKPVEHAIRTEKPAQSGSESDSRHRGLL
jgi:hypothetical protein